MQHRLPTNKLMVVRIPKQRPLSYNEKGRSHSRPFDTAVVQCRPVLVLCQREFGELVHSALPYRLLASAHQCNNFLTCSLRQWEWRGFCSYTLLAQTQANGTIAWSVAISLSPLLFKKVEADGKSTDLAFIITLLGSCSSASVPSAAPGVFLTNTVRYYRPQRASGLKVLRNLHFSKTPIYMLAKMHIYSLSIPTNAIPSL